MALAFFGDSNPISGTSSVTPEGDAGAGWSGGTIQEGDHAFITVSYKQAGATLATPSGWVLIASAQVGTGAVGAGVGPVQLRIYYRQVPSGGLTMPTLTMGGDSTGRVVQAALIVYRGDLGAAGALAYAATAGSDTTSNTSLNVTGSADIGIQTDDALLCYGAVTDDSSTTLSAQALSTSGVVYGSTGNPFNTGTADGDDIRSFASRAIATSGTSTAAPTFAATLGAATTGGALFLRLREVSAEAHRFYLANATPGFSPGVAGASFWDEITAALAVPQQLTGTPEGASASTAIAAPGTGSDQWVLAGQWISHPASAPGTIYGSVFTFIAAWLESNAAADFNPVIYVWVTAGDTSTSRGAAVNRFNSALELPSGTAAGLAYAGSDPAAVSFQAGDRIVVELGFRDAAAISYTGTLYRGGTGTPDLADGVTDLNRPGFIDLLVSPGVVFEETSQTVDGTAAAALGFTATATGRRVANGTAVAALGFAAAAGGAPVVEGTASANLGFTATATGGPLVVGAASAALGFAAAATGTPVVDGEATADLGFTATAEGIVIAPSTGTAAANLGFTATAAGEVIDRVFGTGQADLGFTAQATGQRTAIGSAQADLGFAAHVDGQVRDLIEGTGAAGLGFAAHAAGRRVVDSTAAAALGFAASAAGEVHLPAVFGAAEADLGFIAVAGGTVDAALGVPFLPELDGSRIAVEIAWGADPAGDPDSWTWTDITRDVRTDSGISTKLGRDDEASTSQPASLTLTLDNTSHAYSFGGHSPNWPNVRRNTPVRLRIDEDGQEWHLVFIGNVDGFTPGWDLTGRIPIVNLSASGAMRRMLQGDAPIISAYRRAMTETASVIAYWPFEEGHNATYARAVRGGTDMVTVSSSHEFDADSPFDCSAPLARLRSSPDGVFEDFGATVGEYTVTGQTQVRWLMAFPRTSLPNGAFLCDVFTTGTLGRVSVTYADGGSAPDILPLDGLHLTTWDDDGQVITEDFNIAFNVLGAALRMSVELEQDGSDVIVRLGVVAPGDDEAGFFDVTLPGRTVGRVTSIFMGGNDVDDVILGHVTLQNEITSLYEAAGPLSAHVGELPTPLGAGRLYRLTSEAEVPFTAIGSGAVPSSNETMGPQLARPLMELLHECEAVDQGQLWDGARAPGLIYSTRRFRELGITHLTIDAAAGELAEPFEPTDDDQRNRNRVEATITTGVTAEYEDATGPLGTAAIGIYDSSVEVTNQHDSMAIQYAAWHVALGTVEGYRFPSVTVDLRAAPHLADAVLRTVPGHRIDVLNADQVFAGYLPGDVPLSLIVEGISHDIGARHWRVTFRCSPFSPWGIARVAQETGDTSEYAWRLDTDGTRLVGDHSAGATALTVSNEPLPIANDTFTRTVVNGWGTADQGGAYALAGTTGTLTADFDVAAGRGTMAVTARPRHQFAYLSTLDVQDVDIAVTCTASAVDITGGIIELADVMVRGLGFDDFYYARVTVASDQTVGISIVEVADNLQTEMIPQLIVPGLTFTGTVRCRLRAEGRVLRTRVWNPAGAEPTEWHREVTVDAARSGWVGTRVAVASGNTNALPIVFSHDDLVVTTVYPPDGPLWTTDSDDYPLRLSVGGIPVTATACTGEASPQTFTVEPLPLDRADGVPVALWDPRPIGL
jgi:hypothetical protein